MAAPLTSSTGRILEIGRDPLFALTRPGLTVFHSTGLSLRPGPPAPVVSSGWSRVLFGILRREFDAFVLPAVHVDWAHDASTRKRFVRRTLGTLANSPGLVHCMHRLAGLSGRPVVSLDIVDHVGVSAETRDLLPPSACIAKVNLTTVAAEADSSLRLLPMSLDPAVYAPFTGHEKTSDVFYAAAPVSDARRAVPTLLRRLAARGLQIDAPSERLSFESYLDRMSRARITLSPAGHGQQCWRHYEALLVGSFPVISASAVPMVETLLHDRHGWFYESDPTDAIVALLCDPAALRSRAEAGRAQVLANHSLTAVSDRLLGLLCEQTADFPPAAGREHHSQRP